MSIIKYFQMFKMFNQDNNFKNEKSKFIQHFRTKGKIIISLDFSQQAIQYCCQRRSEGYPGQGEGEQQK